MRLAVLLSSILLTLTACADDLANSSNTDTAEKAAKIESTPVSQASAGASEMPKSTNLLERYQEGVHYFEIETPVAVDDPNKIEVAEMFWYGCSHCFAFEPSLVQWKKDLAADVNFVRVPAMWNPIMEAHARLFYTAKKLGVLEDAHQAIFNEIHINGQRLDRNEDIAILLEKFGADKREVINEINSFGITDTVKKADVRARSYKIGGVPNIVVDGRYRVESNQDVRQADMLSVVDFLVEKTRTAKQ